MWIKIHSNSNAFTVLDFLILQYLAQKIFENFLER